MNQMSPVRFCLLLTLLTIAVSCSEEEPDLPAFEVEIKGDYLTTAEGWVILSNQAGEVIRTKELANDATIRIEVSGSHEEGDIYSLTFVKHYVRQDNGFHEYFIDSYLALEPSHFQLEHKFKLYSTIGNHSIIINNTPTPSSFGAFGLNVFYGYGSSNGTTDLYSGLYDEPADVYYYFFENNDNTHHYKRYQNAHINETVTIDFEDMVEMENETVLSMGTVSKADYQFFSFHEANYNWPFYMHYVQKTGAAANELHIYHPDFSLPEFGVIITSTTGDVTKSYTSLGTSVPTVFKSIDAELTSFTISNNVISFQSTGSFDHLSATAGNEFTGTSDLFRCVLNMPQELPAGYKIPAIPDAILSANPALAAYTFNFDAAIFDYSGLNSYQGYINKTLELNESLYESSNEILSKSYDLN
jgi:hypothetical protein